MSRRVQRWGCTLRMAVAVSLVSGWNAGTAPAQPDAAESKTNPIQDGPSRGTSATTQIDVRGEVTEVTIFRDMAAVTRRLELELQPGRYTIRVLGLPTSASADSIRAFISAGSTINSVDYARVQNRELFVTERPKHEEARRELERRTQTLELERQVLTKQGELLDAIAERTAREVGEGAADLDEITRMSTFLAERRRELLTQDQDLSDQLEELMVELNERDTQWAQRVTNEGELNAAIIAVTVSDLADSIVSLDVTYLVDDASWEPHYTIRADPDDVRVQVDFEALVTQQTGEPWREARVLLSTGQAVVPTEPPSLRPTFVDVANPRRTDDPDAALAGVIGRGGRGDSRFGDWLTSYRVPAPVTVETKDAEPERIRILTLSSRTEYRYVAAPLLAEHAFLRGTVQNTSQAHLLPGSAAVYFGGEFAGSSAVPKVGPDELFEVYFGIDRRVTLRREVVDQERRTTGLLGDGREIKSRIEIHVRNDTGRDVSLELWDRTPVSRDDRIKVSVTKLTHDLTDDEEYRHNGRRRGLLRWDLQFPESGPERRKTVGYTLVVSHKKDVTPTDINP